MEKSNDILLVKFIKEHQDWIELLKSDPYNLHIQFDENLILFKYNQISSDFSNPIVRQCRGIILEDVTYKVVCRPFEKFHNYGEPNAYPIDFSKSVIFEKVDGSLLKVFFYNGEWKVATNGTIDAHYSDTRVTGKTFYDLFMDVVGGEQGFDLMKKRMSAGHTYLFELVHPICRIVVNYGEKKELVFVGWRNTENGMDALPIKSEFEGLDFIRLPEMYGFKNAKLDDLQELADVMNSQGFDFEGFVVAEVDGVFIRGRVKIKSPKYLKFHHLAGGSIYNSLMELILKNEIDEFNAYLTQLPFYVQEIYKDMNEKFNAFVSEGDGYVEKYRKMAEKFDRKTVALHVKDNVKGRFQSFVFSCVYSGKQSFRHALLSKSPKNVKFLIGVVEKTIDE